MSVQSEQELHVLSFSHAQLTLANMQDGTCSPHLDETAPQHSIPSVLGPFCCNQHSLFLPKIHLPHMQTSINTPSALETVTREAPSSWLTYRSQRDASLVGEKEPEIIKFGVK